MLERRRGTRWNGQPFHEEAISRVWLKARETGFPDYRKDAFGSRICFQEYGSQGPDGWEIDHIRPVAAGGLDDLDNLQPLHWLTNLRKGDQYPWAFQKETEPI